MAITLTEEEKKLIQEGKLQFADIVEHRKIHPVRSINVNEVDEIKNEIRDVNEKYKASIQKNKDLYQMLEDNRKEKEQWRNKLAELRLKKKQLLGLIE